MSSHQLQPYIFFYGRCEEALEFYKSIFGGGYELFRVAGTPMEAHTPPEMHQMIMHATFKAPGIEFQAADGQGIKAIDPDEGNITLMLSTPDFESGKRIFDGLAAGGKIGMPLEDAFWGGKFGTVIDKFGNEWYMTTP